MLKKSYLKHEVYPLYHNQPYKIEKGGDYTIPIHGDDRNIPAILIEIRQDLINSVKGQKEWAELMVSMINSCFQNLFVD